MPTTSRQVQEISCLHMRNAAAQITGMAIHLYQLCLEKYLLVTGIAVILPAMIIHLLNINSPSLEARDRATHVFRQFMRVLEGLREIYTEADYATGFLHAALRKVAIDLNVDVGHQALTGMTSDVSAGFSAHTRPSNNLHCMTAPELLFNEKRKPSVKMPMIPPNTNASARQLSTNLPPQRDFYSADLTPSVSGQSDGDQFVDLDMLNLDLLQGHIGFDWNAIAGTGLDVDQ